MADSKITALTAISTVDPTADPLVIVDVSDTSMAASGTTKKSTINQLLGAGGTATLASATITGAATVGTTLGVTGVSTFAAGTALLPALTTTGDTNTGIYYPAADTFAVTTGGTERYRVDSSGNVGVGVTPSAWSGNTAIQLKSSASSITGAIFQGANGGANANGFAYNCYFDGTNWQYIFGTSHPATRYQQSQGIHSWFNAASGTGAITFTQAMTLDASGNLLVGTTGLNATWNTRLTLSSDSGTTRWAVGPYSTATNFVISGASGGGVYLNGTAATSWTSASDERLKDIIEPIGNAVAKVGSLRAVIGKFKNDSLNTRKSFLIAQDVQSVLPEAVDASNPDQLGVAYTDVIPLLVAAIKELTARVQTLEAR